MKCAFEFKQQLRSIVISMAEVFVSFGLYNYSLIAISYAIIHGNCETIQTWIGIVLSVRKIPT